jgi:hypothetical protein
MDPTQLIRTPADKVFPVEKSRCATNSNYHYCPSLEQRQAYSVCLHTIEVVTTGGENGLRTECSDPILKGTCPALSYREDEILAGRALYYNDRAEWLAKFEAENPPAEIRYGKRSALPKESLSSRNFELRQKQLEAMPLADPVPAMKAGPAPKNDDGLDAKLVNRNLIAEAINAVAGGRT